MAVLSTVSKVDDEADQQPNEEPEPCVAGQGSHQPQAGENTQDRHQRYQGRPERPIEVRTCPAQDPNSDTHQNKGQQSPDVDQLTEYLYRERRTDDGDNESNINCREIRGAVARMHLAR